MSEKEALIELHGLLSNASVPLALAAPQLAEMAVPTSGVVDDKLIGSVPPSAIRMAPLAEAFSLSAVPIANASVPLARAIPTLG